MTVDYPMHLRTLDGRSTISVYPAGPPPAKIGRYVVSQGRVVKPKGPSKTARASRLIHRALSLLIQVENKEDALRIALQRLMDEDPKRYWQAVEVMAAQENLRTDYR